MSAGAAEGTPGEVASRLTRASSRQIPTTVHGHYLESVPPGPGPHPVLVGFHGYGETIEEHFEELLRIPGSEGWLVVAVQALHLFYRTRTGEVVASWMTRLNREPAIASNIAYVASVVAELKQRHSLGAPGEEKLVYAGFSQGVAMAYRAAAASGHAAAGLIALAGDVPPDVAEGLATSPDLATAYPRVLIGRGQRDAYPAEQMRKDEQTLAAKGIPVETHTFPGGHEWTADFRERVGKFLAQLR